MSFSCVIFNKEKGHHVTGVGSTPDRAVLEAYKKDIRVSAEEALQDQLLTNASIESVRSLFKIVRIDDTNYEEPKSLSEQISSHVVLLSFDRCADAMYAPVGFISYVQ